MLLKFDAYPWQEFGTVTATVDYVSAIPADSGLYMAKLSLPKELITNYNKPIVFKEGLLAQAEIITKDNGYPCCSWFRKQPERQDPVQFP